MSPTLYHALRVKDCRPSVRVWHTRRETWGVIVSKRAYLRLGRSYVTVHWDGDAEPDGIIIAVRDLRVQP